MLQQDSPAGDHPEAEPAGFPADSPIVRVLTRPLPDHERTRRYQQVLDDCIDRIKADWDLERGLRGTRGVELPHETIAGYWEMPSAERWEVTPSEARDLYKANAGRQGTSALALAAFCRRSPLSRHRGDPELLRFFEAGLRFFTGSIGSAGIMSTYGLNGEHWAHGWDVEGLLYGLIWCGRDISPAIRDEAIGRFHRAATAMMGCRDIGSYGNQRCVYILGLYLYGQLLNMRS